MKPQTMILSLLLSRWKHMVTTSSSSAFSQKLMPWLRQKAFVQSAHDVDAVLRAWSSCEGEEEEEEGGLWKRDRWADWCWGPRGMIVLFLKHVHLQNRGAAAIP
ncbi:hypothetical protein CCMA1212_000416 [Trichoderma ghanense]|uniref:Secreted protein n=1 Tax=Trichoderma ghanense TaxID=65468 RepID=A0ABY2HEC6_9HYPO